MIDRDSWVVIISVIFIAGAVFAYFSFTGTVNIDWKGIFNIKEYPKN